MISRCMKAMAAGPPDTVSPFTFQTIWTGHHSDYEAGVMCQHQPLDEGVVPTAAPSTWEVLSFHNWGEWCQANPVPRLLWGETESIMVLCLWPLTLSNYNRQYSSSSLHQYHVLQFLI